MNERPVLASPDVMAAQARARQPSSSVWVAANAGAGKTHVLTERVLALLLDGAAPEGLLCLTYTKAAAAEMRARVSARLGQWAVMDDEELRTALEALDKKNVTAEQLAFARTLFARALETPGGLKINTIHAFAESLLQRFPLEAGVPLGFSVIEERAQQEMIAAVRDAVLLDAFEAQGARTGVRKAMDVLYATMSDHTIAEATDAGLAKMRELRPVLADVEEANRRVTAALGGPFPDEAEIVDRVLGERLVDATLCGQILGLGAHTPNGKSAIDRLARIDSRNPSPTDLFGCFLTQGGTPLKVVVRKPFAKAHPKWAALLVAEAERLAELHGLMRRARQCARSTALTEVLGAVLHGYERQKQARALLDFDDLVARALALLTRRELGAWVRYKLDQGITHILVDESQDTNPEQWAVIDALAEEFFAGEGAIERPRSIFAVGDQKQSIYSFQGADPTLFPTAGRAYQRKVEVSGKAFTDVRLRASFRTLDNILQAVDRTFGNPALAAALLSAPQDIVHQSARADQGGVVALWPLEIKQDTPQWGLDWPLAGPESSPSGAQSVSSAPADYRLAERIATAIRQWLDEGRHLPARGREIVPDDILILVQTRSALFSHLVRALKQRQIPSPGADRLAVAAHIAVLDLIALGEVMLNPADDLSLAALLRSPLFDLSEVQICTLAHGRGDSLVFDRLAASQDEAARAAHARLTAWQSRLARERPFEFYAHVLYTAGGLARFHHRLGSEVDDVLAEFMDLALAQEQADQPGLAGFLNTLRARDDTIKRELSEAGAGVRVMTVHGAKGLEAPIVILADAASPPSSKQLSQHLLFGKTPKGSYLLHRQSGDDDGVSGQLNEELQQKLRAEYWRKLYVGMTRAEDELHLAGVCKNDKAPEKSWYGAAAAALANDSGTLEFGAAGDVAVFPKQAVQTLGPEARGKRVRPSPIAGASAQPLRLAFVPAPPQPRPLHPSSAAKDAVPDAGLGLESGLKAGDLENDAARPAERARAEGIALHALLQHLPRVRKMDRGSVAAGALRQLLPQHRDQHKMLIERAMSLLETAHLQEIFGPDARAEVPIIASGTDKNGPFRLTGRIDRLLVSDQKALIVDFKSDAQPPRSVEAIPPAYLRQLGLYALAIAAIWPDLEVEAGIVWTANASLQRAPHDVLAKAVQDVQLRANGTGTA